MNPKISLISIDDNREQAWIYSRPEFDHSDIKIEDAVSMDMAFNSLCMLTFEISSSVMFRDFIFSIRPLFAWAMSSRDLPFTKERLNISSEFNNWGMDGLDKAISMVESGIHQNKARAFLPATMSTSYTMSMDFRSVVGLIKTMEFMNKDLYNIYGTQFEREIKDIKGFKNSKVKEFYNSYCLLEQELIASKAVKIGEIIHGVSEMKSALASQFLRQSHSIIKTNIWNEFKEIGYTKSSEIYQTENILVSYYIPHNAYETLMKSRSHWYADWAPDMWGNIVGDYISEMSIEEFWDFIPNGNGKKDPFEYHTLKRIKGEDLNSPCPIILEQPDLIYERLEDQGENKIIKRYIELEKKGYIRDNPENKLRKMYAKRHK